MRFKDLVLVPVVAVVAAFATAPEAAAVSAPRLLIGQDFPDPDVVKTAGGCFAFSTGTKAPRVPLASATAPDGPWRVAGDALGAVPAWAKPDGGFWAPDVTQLA